MGYSQCSPKYSNAPKVYGVFLHEKDLEYVGARLDPGTSHSQVPESETMMSR